jgi:DNA (cytosine-5)-methyltransferase 1
VIFIGVREDLNRDPVFPKPLPYRYTVADALPWLIGQGYAGESSNDKWPRGGVRDTENPSPTIGASPMTGQNRFPSSLVVHDTSGQFSTGDVTNRPMPTILVGDHSMNSRHYQVHEPGITYRRGPKDEPSFRSADDPAPTIAAHGIGPAREYQGGVQSADGIATDPETGKDLSLTPSYQRNYNRLSHLGQIAPTILTHDRGFNAANTMVRRFTLGELRRICGFPDDFVLTGSYEQRWERLGRAVPPPMMAAVAAGIRDLLS